MKIQELKLLVAVADELHFGRAADRMGMAQPQLSASIRRIEQEAGVAIFTRRPRVGVTPAGAEMVDMARRLLAELQSGTARARAIAAGQIGKASLGFSAPAMLTNLPALLQQFVAGRANVELKMVEGTTGSLRQQLEQGRLDVVVAREPISGEGLESIKFAPDYMNVLFPAGHPAASRETVDPATLAGEALILFPRASAPQYYNRIALWCRENGLELKVARETESLMAVFGMVSAGLGISFGTETLSRIPFPGTVSRKLGRHPLDVSFWMSWDPARMTPVSEQLIHHIRHQKV
ncbi:MAG: LysR family transcriptional regulator [Pseudomonadota bacterium]|nr:LysR family transcriptional regulator [Pseudomonadota bacterium]